MTWPLSKCGKCKVSVFFPFSAVDNSLRIFFNVCLHLLLSCTKKKLRFIETEKRIKGEAFTVYVLLLMKCR